MIIISPSDSNHTISIIPRTLNVTNDHTFALTNEDTRVTTNISNTKVIRSGYIDYSITLVNTEGQSFALKISDDTTGLVVWRGKIYSTAQTTQNFVINV